MVFDYQCISLTGPISQWSNWTKSRTRLPGTTGINGPTWANGLTGPTSTTGPSCLLWPMDLTEPTGFIGTSVILRDPGIPLESLFPWEDTQLHFDFCRCCAKRLLLLFPPKLFSGPTQWLVEFVETFSRQQNDRNGNIYIQFMSYKATYALKCLFKKISSKNRFFSLVSNKFREISISRVRKVMYTSSVQ